MAGELKDTKNVARGEVKEVNQPPKTDRVGVHKVGLFFGSAGWLFREQTVGDYGIDAQVEIANGDEATGALIGIQIKSGQSYFSEQTANSIIFRSNDKHIKYWLGHRLPVIIILYDDQRDRLFWEVVSQDTIKKTAKNWRIDVPKNNILTLESLEKLKNLTQPPPYIQKLNRLRLDRAWIDLILAGETVHVEFEDWVNKSLPRFSVQIGCDSKDCIASQTWPTIYGPGLSFEELLEHLFPWAEFAMDEEAYEQFMEERWDSECYCGYDREDGVTYHTMPFSEFYEPPEGIVPISENGETEGYRLILSLNELGRASVLMDDHLREDDGPWNQTFSI